jgi:hypothetical protein
MTSTAVFVILGTAIVLSGPLWPASHAGEATSAAPGLDVKAHGFSEIGRLKTRHARDISGSMWSIGGETLDRDNAIYANYKSHLGPLGAKAIRLQAGWAKCEKERGVYEWAWLDEAVRDASAQGVRSWLQTSYGNPIYPGGGEAGLGGSLPSSPEARAAWDAWVRALAGRYKDRVREWEIWNEPDLNALHPTIGSPVTAEDYTELFVRTARIIRSEQGDAKIYGLALAGDGDFAKEFLVRLEAHGHLDLLDAVTFHGYKLNPDDMSLLTMLRALTANHAPHVQLRQGETGAPSGKTVAALSQYEWNELRQAKWNLRRMLGHHGHNVPASLFTLVDLRYTQKNLRGMNRKGLLLAHEDRVVERPKHSYFASQRIFSLLDDSFQPAQSLGPGVPGVLAYGYRKRQGPGALVTYWLRDIPPGDSLATRTAAFTFVETAFTKPLLVDPLSGIVYAIPPEAWSIEGGTARFRSLPYGDSPLVVADESVLTVESRREIRGKSGTGANNVGDGLPPREATRDRPGRPAEEGRRRRVSSEPKHANRLPSRIIPDYPSITRGVPASWRWRSVDQHVRHFLSRAR